jgi:hypothetical protein
MSAPELHTGIAATRTGYKAWVVGLSPYSPSIGHWDEVDTFASRAKADVWVDGIVRNVRQRASVAGVAIRVRAWVDGVEKP